MPLMPPPTTRMVWLVAIEAVTSSSRVDFVRREF
jgi:hypothetical protein